MFGSLDKLDEKGLSNPLLIVLDTPNFSRIDGVDINLYKTIIKIDHHPFEEKMGEIELVDETMSSTCEIIYNLIKNTPLKMNEKIAENLYLGIISDSDRFLVSTTSYNSFQVCADILKEYKFDVKELYNRLYERPLNELKLQAFITLNMTVTENNFAYMKLSNAIIKGNDFDITNTSNMVNNFNYIKEVNAWAFITYEEGQELFKVNIRSRGPVINEAAAKFNGGGHKFAAGARLTKVEDINLLLKELDEVCKKYNEEKNNR